MGSQYWLEMMNKVSKEKDKFLKLLKQLNEIDFSQIISILSNTGKSLEKVAPNGVAFDEGKFDECLNNINTYASGIKNLIDECNEKIDSLTSLYNLYSENYQKALAEEKAAAEAAMAANSKKDDD